MSDSKRLSRRDFSRRSVMVILSDVTGQVSANHGHAAVISAAEIASGNAVTLFIDSEAGHPHAVDLTADEVTAIADGDRVSKVSSTFEGDDPLCSSLSTHSHRVTFN